MCSAGCSSGVLLPLVTLSRFLSRIPLFSVSIYYHQPRINRTANKEHEKKRPVVKKKQEEPVGARIYKCERVYIIVKLPRLLFQFIHYQRG
jgi:hypothetical protein